MLTFRIEGQQPLQGTITVGGSKNASTKLLAAALLTSGACRIKNVPDIEDVRRLLELLESVGATITRPAPHELIITAETVNPDRLDTAAVRKLRASVLLMGALLGRCGSVTIPGPGGDQIGARPLDTHIEIFRALGIHVEVTSDGFHLKQRPAGDVTVTMGEFSVTATENVILASVLAKGETVIRCAAIDPSVQELCWFLSDLGAEIQGIGTHTLTIRGVKKLGGTMGYPVMPDPVEAGTFLALAAAARAPLKILRVPYDFMQLELQKFSDVGVRVVFERTYAAEHGRYTLADVQVHTGTELRALRKIENMPYPGFNPDLLPPFTVLLSQASGTTLVHDWMYEGRLKYVEELNKMGADIFIADPHRILVTGPRNLYGSTINNYDIRTGASLLIAALIASGSSRLSPVYQIDRGYERIDERLRAIGANIVREEL